MNSTIPNEKDLPRIPFLQRFHAAIVSGDKTMTCRYRAYGRAGDLFRGPRRTILKLLRVEKVKLGVVAREFYREEGCASPEDFKWVWDQLHGPKAFDPLESVWLHEFEVVRQFRGYHHVRDDGDGYTRGGVQ